MFMPNALKSLARVHVHGNVDTPFGAAHPIAASPIPDSYGDDDYAKDLAQAKQYLTDVIAKLEANELTVEQLREDMTAMMLIENLARLDQASAIWAAREALKRLDESAKQAVLSDSDRTFLRNHARMPELLVEVRQLLVGWTVAGPEGVTKWEPLSPDNWDKNLPTGRIEAGFNDTGLWLVIMPSRSTSKPHIISGEHDGVRLIDSREETFDGVLRTIRDFLGGMRAAKLISGL